MATPGMSWQQHYYGGSAAGATKFTPSPAAAQQAGHGMDYSQDLHLKMSKKIAQLTKVRAGLEWVRRRLGAGRAGLTCQLGGCAPCAGGELSGAVRGKQQLETCLQEPFKLRWNLATFI